MANKALSTIAADINTNAATLAGTASNVTTAEYQAIAALLTLLSTHHGYSVPLLKLLSDTHRQALTVG